MGSHHGPRECRGHRTAAHGLCNAFLAARTAGKLASPHQRPCAQIDPRSDARVAAKYEVPAVRDDVPDPAHSVPAPVAHARLVNVNCVGTA